jgi:carboxypeptidase C (cathepsin A)
LRDDVSQALNVCGEAGYDAFSGDAGGCIDLYSFDSRDSFDYSGALARALDEKIPVTLYYGKTDTACDYKGGVAMANTIAWSKQADFANKELEPLIIADTSVGQYKSVAGLTFIQVESAGHMVPLDQPIAAAYAINSILDTI